MYIEFISQYWYLFAILCTLVFLLFLDPAGGQKISALELPQLQARQDAVIVDVSSAQEFQRGHIERALNLPLSGLKDNLKKLNKHKSKTIILICQTGAQSAKAAGILRDGEFSQVRVLGGGLAAWRRENLPLTKS